MWAIGKCEIQSFIYYLKDPLRCVLCIFNWYRRFA